MRSRLILFHEMLLTHMKNTFSSSKEGIRDYLEQHTKVSMIAFIVPLSWYGLCVFAFQAVLLRFRRVT